jgi:hypothetical protein
MECSVDYNDKRVKTPYLAPQAPPGFHMLHNTHIGPHAANAFTTGEITFSHVPMLRTCCKRLGIFKSSAYIQGGQ